MRNLASQPPQGLPFPLDSPGFWTAFAGELVEHLFVTYLEDHLPSVSSPMLLLGIVTQEIQDPGETPGRRRYRKRTLHWGRLADVISPDDLVEEVYGWGGAEFQYARFLSNLREVLKTQGFLAGLGAPDPQRLDRYYAEDHPLREEIQELHVPIVGGMDAAEQIFEVALSVLPVPPQGAPSGAPVGFAVAPLITGTLPPLQFGTLTAELGGGFALDQGIRLEIRPQQMTAVSPGNEIDAEIALADMPEDPLVLIGNAQSQRLQARGFRCALRARGAVDDPEVQLEFVVRDAELVLDLTDGDGFTRRLAGTEERRVGFDTGVAWSSKHGLTFKGQGGLKTIVPVEKQIGIVIVDALILGLGTGDGVLALDAGISGRGKLGPVTVIVDGLGLQFKVRPRGDAEPPGNFGLVDVDLGLLFPSGIGLKLEVSPGISGGGFIAREPDRDRWLGAFGLKIDPYEFEGVVMTERGSVIAVLWFQGFRIPLFGGAIVGVGILLAHQRRGDREAFLAGLKGNALDAVLFPADPVATAPQILATLGRLFPRAEGRTVVGLLARWVFGEKAELIVVELGILVEFGGGRLHNVYLLGQGRVRLADLPENIFSINVELFGNLDFEHGELLIFASLRNSRLAGGDLSGDGMLYSGPLMEFLLTAGGFNPRFNVPAGLPTVRRLAARIADSDNLKPGFQLYAALTASNIQFGGRAFVWAGAGGFSIEGLLEVDVLAPFDFTFVVDLMFAVALKRGRRVLAGIDFEGTLTGVSPFTLDGRATLKLLFFKVSVPVALEFGGGGPVRYPEVDALAPLVQALEAPENWTGAADAGIVLAERDRDGLWAVSHGPLRVSQRAVPLDHRLTRLGPSPLRQPRRFIVETVELGNQGQTWDAVEEDFSLGLFQDVDLDESIRAPLVEKLQSGLELAGNAADSGEAVAASAGYEEIRVDAPVSGAGATNEPGAGQPGAAATPSTISHPPLEDYPLDEADFYRVAMQPVVVEPPRFLAVDDDLNPDEAHDETAVATGVSYARARECCLEAGARRHVVRRYEVAQEQSPFG